MTAIEIEKKLIDALQELNGKALAGPPQIRDVVVDSLDLMKLVVKLEETFGIYIDEQYLADPRMFETEYIVGIIEKSLGQGESSMERSGKGDRPFLGRDYLAALKAHHPELVKKETIRQTDKTLHVGLIERWMNVGPTWGEDHAQRYTSLRKRMFMSEKNAWDFTGINEHPERAAALSYKGLINLKPPVDLLLYSNLIWELQPQTILEFGALQGGSSLWFADQLDTQCGAGEVHAFELLVDCVHPSARHPRLTFHSVDLRNLATLDRGLLAGLPHPWIVIDDAHENRYELGELLAGFMKSDDYYVLEDLFCFDGTAETIARTVDVWDRLGFVVDTKYCDALGYNVTCSPNGWLKKV